MGSADVYCYACDDARLDPHLAKHLSNFGIEVASQSKTEKSMTELVRPHISLSDHSLIDCVPQQVEQNLRFDFAMTGEDGKELEPVFGPGLTGLRNLGNR
jgi:ubiquitin carboxyl-terminal hydrolase 5/13